MVKGAKPQCSMAILMKQKMIKTLDNSYWSREGIERSLIENSIVQFYWVPWLSSKQVLHTLCFIIATLKRNEKERTVRSYTKVCVKSLLNHVSAKSFDASLNGVKHRSWRAHDVTGFCTEQYSYRALGTRCAGHLACLGWNARHHGTVNPAVAGEACWDRQNGQDTMYTMAINWQIDRWDRWDRWMDGIDEMDG
jgi:hypothetical protein